MHVALESLTWRLVPGRYKRLRMGPFDMAGLTGVRDEDIRGEEGVEAPRMRKNPGKTVVWGGGGPSKQRGLSEAAEKAEGFTPGGSTPRARQ